MPELRYRRPAANWNEALPLGNGWLGAMCHGGTRMDRFQLNDDTVWSGGEMDRVNPSALGSMAEIRKLIREGRIREAEELTAEALTGLPESERVYEPLCDLSIQFATEQNPRFLDLRSTDCLRGKDLGQFEPEIGVEDYVRKLDLDTGIHTVSYTLDGESFRREALVSRPHGVLAIRLTGGRARAALRRECRLISDAPVDEKTMLLQGRTANDGIRYCCALRAVGENVRICGDVIHFEDEAVLYVSSATDFRDGENFIQAALNRVNEAEQIGWDKIKKAHLADIRPAMDACRLELEYDPALDKVPTDERLQRVIDGGSDEGLVNTLFEYGRYMLFSCSRPGGMAANLQGIWNEHFTPPWGCKCTININTEMNYWPAEKCALSEEHEPLFALLRRMTEKGADVARDMYGAGGWTAHHNTDIWADCAPQDLYLPASYWPMGGAWMSLHIWEHYRYTPDRDFLEEYYPVLEGAAAFFADILEERDGILRVSPSCSPENVYLLPNGETGCLCDDAAMDQQILWELFDAVVKGAEVLGKDPGPYPELMKKLKPVVVQDGLVREWISPDKAETAPGHRHISHLFALYPGNQITSEMPEAFAAARGTLERRLAHGGGHTGWSRAWIVNLWARLLDGEKAEENVRLLMAKSMLPNLFDNHPPFQIDGNFGLISGIAEMLMQSHEGFLRLLPALPEKWPNGKITGLKARGGYTVNIEWRGGKLHRAEIRAERDGELKLSDGRTFPHRAGSVIDII